jgi:hypothetical protein
MERFRSVLGEAPRNHPAAVSADYTSPCRECAHGHQHVVLDIAKGPGEPALGIAALLGPEGRALGPIVGVQDFRSLDSGSRSMRVSRSQSVAEQKQEDRSWRERFVQNALANVRLEGLEPSPKA